MRVLISPAFTGPDQGDGGIRRVVEAQVAGLAAHGIEVVDREQDADLVAVHAGALVPTNKPVVAHCHGLYWTEYMWSRWALDLNRQVVNTLRRSDACTAPSDWVGYILKRGMNLDAQTVYHGLDAEEWEPAPKPHPYVLWNKTRVDPICDPAPLSRLVEMMPNTDFVSTYTTGNGHPNLRVTGRLPYQQAKNLVQCASVYLCTSRETFGIGTLEAMAAGAIVVGFNWGGQAEIIEHGVDGLLVTPGDMDALAHAVQLALSDDGTMRNAALKKVRTQFTWERACATYAALYRDTLERVPAKRVSVVITCYNLAKSLPRAVASVDMDDAEIVVVDDASPDDTAAVAAELAAGDARVRVVTNPSNLYLAGSLDAGISVAQGRYVVPLDADNELAPGALAALAGVLDTDSDVDIAYGSMQVVEERDGEAGRLYVSGWPTAFHYESQMAHRNQIPSTSMYRKKWWERAGGYRRRCRTAEDADFWCRVTSLGAQPRKVTERPTLIYHDRKDSMSHVEADWPWEAWYTWSRVPDLTPWGAPQGRTAVVPTYQPAAVTVVIPVGPGHDVYLPDALDSLVAQTYIGWRCIVVDDRPYPADSLTVPPWVEVRTPVNKDGLGGGTGPACARNMGLGAVRTPYVLFLDADDYLAPNALELMVRAAQERGWTGREWFYSDWYKQEEKKVYRAPDFNVEHLRTHLTHSVTAMYPTALLREVGGFDEGLDAWEDWDMVLKLIEAEACGVHLPFPLFYYRYHAGWRREELYKDRKRHTDVMKRKWRKYMVENHAMPCGCAGGQTVYIAPVQVNGAPVPVSKDGKTLVEYTGTHAPRTWRGPSGTEYRFGNDPGHQRSYVLNEDLGTFMNRLGFRVAVADSEGNAILEALGPPNRTAEFMEPVVAAG